MIEETHFVWQIKQKYPSSSENNLPLGWICSYAFADTLIFLPWWSKYQKSVFKIACKCLSNLCGWCQQVPTGFLINSKLNKTLFGLWQPPCYILRILTRESDAHTHRVNWGLGGEGELFDETFDTVKGEWNWRQSALPIFWINWALNH